MDNNRIGLIEELIFKEFYFLEEEYSYDKVSQIDKNPLFIESLGITYTNKIRRREVEISYVKKNVTGIVSYSFIISITRLPYSSWEDFFSFGKYLESIGKDIQISFENEFDEAKARMIIHNLALLLRDTANDILKGDIWYEKFYPRKD